MKQILKKSMMLLCAMIVTIGFVGGATEEVSAASKVYGGTSTVSIVVPKGSHSLKIKAELFDGKVLVKAANSKIEHHNLKKGGTGTLRISATNTKNKSYKLKITVTNELGKDYSDTKTIKVKDLGKKSYKVKLSKGFADFGYIDKVKFS